jgi:ureidoglycolate lyase
VSVPQLRPRPLTGAAFARFGSVVEGADQGHAVNAGTAIRADQAAGWAPPVLAVYRCRPQALPLAVRLVERHPHSSQTFLPLTALRFLVVVLESAADGTPATQTAAAFLATAGQGITYARGVWHSPLIALDRAADFAMLMWETGRGDDTETYELAEALTISP